MLSPLIQQQIPACPKCASRYVIRKGKRRNRLQLLQLFQCGECLHRFTAAPGRNKTYPLKVILDALSLYNLGHSITAAGRLIRNRNHIDVPQGTFRSWIKIYRPFTTYARMRTAGLRLFGPGTAIRSLDLEHRQVYRFQVHQPKLDLLLDTPPHRHLAPVRTYLRGIGAHFPHDIFVTAAQRSSTFPALVHPAVTRKENHATRTAALVLPTSPTNVKRHETLQRFMIVNDSVTVAVEVPVYLTQDDIAYYREVSARLTLNLGVRWEAETGTGESHNRLSYFDPNATNTAGGRGAIYFTGNGHPGTIRATNWTNFGPRAGFAWRPIDKWVVRGGYGVFYLPIGLEPTLTTTPFNYTLTADSLNPDYTPKVTLSNPFPAGLPRPNSATPANDGSYQLGTNSNVVLRDQPAEYMQEWNVAISRQVARTTVLTLTYNGSRGVHLPIPSMELNQMYSGFLSQGSALTQLVPNPYYGKFSSGLLAQQNIPLQQLLKPFPTFAGSSTANAFGASLTAYRPPVGDSIYHAVTIQFERRFTRGLSVNAHYTWSKLIDVGGVGNGAAFTDPSALRDIYNVRLERSLGSYDVPHRLIVTYALDLPFGRGKMFGHGLVKGPKWADRVLSGWQLVGFHTVQSGLPVNVGGPDLSRLAGASPSRASVVPGVKAAYSLSTSIANARAYNPACGCTLPWFNPAAFTTTPQFVIPNGPRFLPDVRAGFLRNWDLTLTKNVLITERVKFGLQAKFYNLLNQVTFAGPSVLTVGSASFGSGGGVNQAARAMELGGKLTF